MDNYLSTLHYNDLCTMAKAHGLRVRGVKGMTKARISELLAPLVQTAAMTEDVSFYHQEFALPLDALLVIGSFLDNTHFLTWMTSCETVYKATLTQRSQKYMAYRLEAVRKGYLSLEGYAMLRNRYVPNNYDPKIKGCIHTGDKVWVNLRPDFPWTDITLQVMEAYYHTVRSRDINTLPAQYLSDHPEHTDHLMAIAVRRRPRKYEKIRPLTGSYPLTDMAMLLSAPTPWISNNDKINYIHDYSITLSPEDKVRVAAFDIGLAYEVGWAKDTAENAMRLAKSVSINHPMVLKHLTPDFVNEYMEWYISQQMEKIDQYIDKQFHKINKHMHRLCLLASK